MRNPVVTLTEQLSRIDLNHREFINVFVGGPQPIEQLNNVELHVIDDTLFVVVDEKFLDKIQVRTYEEIYGS